MPRRTPRWATCAANRVHLDAPRLAQQGHRRSPLGREPARVEGEGDGRGRAGRRYGQPGWWFLASRPAPRPASADFAGALDRQFDAAPQRAAPDRGCARRSGGPCPWPARCGGAPRDPGVDPGIEDPPAADQQIPLPSRRRSARRAPPSTSHGFYFIVTVVSPGPSHQAGGST